MQSKIANDVNPNELKAIILIGKCHNGAFDPKTYMPIIELERQGLKPAKIFLL
jgi:hypothetical protein